MTPIEYAIAEFKPVSIKALFSGGGDSLTSTHYSMEHGAHGVVHIKTGIGVDEGPGLSVEEYVRETCKAQGWPLRVMTPPDIDYREMVLRFGFPGAGAHRYPYSWLKERCIAQLVRETKKRWRDRVGLCTGVHQSESARRMGYVTPCIRHGARVWIAPLYDWNKIQFADYRAQHNLEVSNIVKLIGMSGECFCGAFAKPHELEAKIRPNFPRLYAHIISLQEQVKEVLGRRFLWGQKARMRRHKDQGEIPFMPLCVNCHAADEITGGVRQ